MMPDQKQKKILLGFGFALFLNLEGLLVNILGLSIKSGFLNQLYAPLGLGLLILSFVLNYHSRIQKGNKKVSILFLSTSLLTVLIIFTSLFYVDVSKFLRDLIYIWLIYVIYQLYHWNNIGYKYIDREFIKGFAFSFLIIFPVTYLPLISSGELSRFSGWILSKPQFANMVLLTGLLVLGSRFQSLQKYLTAVICFFLIVTSGTRSTLLIFTLYLGYYFFILESKEGLKRIIWATGIVSVIAILIITLFFKEIIVLLEFASNYRAFSIDDGGSIMSRMTWYMMVLESLYIYNIFGGFGAGASEELLSVLTHFDFLRFWYDYTLIFAVIFMYNLLFIYFEDRFYSSKLKKLFDGVVLVAIIFTLMVHNVFQSFSLVILIMIFLLNSKRNSSNEISRSIYRISVNPDSGSNRRVWLR